MFFFNFSLEIREIIINSIVDKKSILNSRLVCKEWYDLIPIVYEYNQDGLILKHIFSNNKFKTINCLVDLTIKEIEFKSYGKYLYLEYKINGDLKKKVESYPPYKTICYDYHLNSITKKTYDTRKKKVESIFIPYYIHPNACIIS